LFLALGDVGLVERVDLEHRSHRRRRDLPAQELACDLHGSGQLPLQERLARLREMAHVVRFALQREGDEEAVVAVRLGLSRRLAVDGNDPASLLAGALGDELLQPGAEMATKLDPSATWARKCRWKQSTSVVVPLFELTRKSVRPRSNPRAAARTASGAVESSTRKSSPPSRLPRMRAITSGASDDPPMPSSTQCRNFRPASAANAEISFACSLPKLVASNQPSRVFATFFGPHNEASLAQMRAATFFSRAASSPAVASSRRLPRLSRSCALRANVCAAARAA